MTRKLKWIGLGDSEYITRCGTFLVQLQDKDWYLFRRIGIDNIIGQPKWEWSDSLFNNKRKGICQDHAESHPEAPAKTKTESPATAVAALSVVREALSGFKHWDDQTNATCWCCGVPFFRGDNYRFGNLCGSGCVEILEEVLGEIK